MNLAKANPEPFARALESFDAANAEDPRREKVGGREIAQELLYGRRMSACLERYAAEASEALRLAVRSQHLCRWRILRTSYAQGRRGYLAWRRACAAMHAELATKILSDVGYGEEMTERVADLLQKKNRKSDAETQTLEDVACLVFLESYAEEFLQRQDEEKLERILIKTWRKMSPPARQTALQMSLPPLVGKLVGKILSASGRSP